MNRQTAFLVLSLTLAACGKSSTPIQDAGHDTHADSNHDATADIANDDGSSRDSSPDGTNDVSENDVSADVADLPATGRQDGESCDDDGECAGGTCLTDWSGGYCTTVGCTDANDCSTTGADNRCLVSANNDNMCVRFCDAIDDCRRGYRCESVGAFSYCAPDPSVVIDPAALSDLPYPVTCPTAQNGNVSFDYTVAATTTSYQVVPFNIFGDRVDPVAIDLPDNTMVDFNGANAFQIVNDPDFIQATTIPATDDFSTQVMAGAHTYRLTTNSSEACFYLVEEDAPGTTIDLNIYFVGVPNLSSATVAQNADFQTVLQRFDAILANVGMSRGITTYRDITGQDALDYGVIRNLNDLYALAALSETPTGDVLSVNVFYVQSFAIGSIGFSSALPGPAGLHGTAASGIILTSEFLGQMPTDSFGNQHDGNFLTAQITAHELGHMLGLFHTSENTGATHDPLDDTPECFQSGSLNCPDVDNLMFFAAGDSRIGITNDQTFVLGAHPLTK